MGCVMEGWGGHIGLLKFIRLCELVSSLFFVGLKYVQSMLSPFCVKFLFLVVLVMGQILTKGGYLFWNLCICGVGPVFVDVKYR